MDNKEGHIIPSFGLAAQLRKKGHNIVYLSIADNRALVEDQGFRFYPIFRDVYPEGFHQANKLSGALSLSHAQRELKHMLGILDGVLDPFLEEYAPDLFIISAFLSLESLLLHYKYHIRPVMLTTYLRDTDMTLMSECLGGLLEFPADVMAAIADALDDLGIRFSSLMELLQPLDTFDELVLCPGELNIGPVSTADRTWYLGPTIYQDKALGNSLDISGIRDSRKIIYASMGSYAVTYGPACTAFFSILTSILRKGMLPDTHLVLAVGKEFDTAILEPLPPDVTVCRWISQTNLLQSTALVITHGGLGTIKESIYYGIPMIVMPMGYDQVRNAMLVEHHRLGLRRRLEEVTEESLASDIRYLLTDPHVQRQVRQMQSIFCRKEEQEEGCALIERFLLRNILK